MKLQIKGKPSYIKRMYKHLRKEHPSTRKRMSIVKNRKGDIPSIFYAIVSVFVFGIVIFVFSHLFLGVYNQFDNFIEGSVKYNNTQADISLDKVIDYEQSMWDYVFLFIAIGYILLLMIFAFSTYTNRIFYFIYVIASFFGLVIGVALSNLWQTMAANAEFATTITRFPITNAILGNFFPLFIVVMVVMTTILLFGKFGSGQESMR